MDVDAMNSRKRVKKEDQAEVKQHKPNAITEFEKELGSLLMMFPTISITDVNKATSKVMKVIREEVPWQTRGIEAYRIFVKENMPKVKAVYPNMNGQQRMKEVARMWQEYKAASHVTL